MKTIVVYDSVYGNTEKIAKSIGGAVTGDVKVISASEVNPSELESVDLLIVGAPTQAFRPTKPVQTIINNIPEDTLKGVNVAAFDTRISASEVGKGLRLLMKVGGHAAPHIANVLKKKGGNLVVPAEGFFVKDREGPLKEGELERAASWAKEVVESKK
jgi:flavodoxin I